ncbi:MAG: VCBS repeat-containing protein [Ignavibacteria bacterium]|nr:VCBS repeat-containing protein [Ignavibacteria bacterium]
MHSANHTASLLALLMLSGTALAQTSRTLWTFDVRDASFGQTAAGDIDRDGKLELVFGCYRNDSCIYALNAEDGSLLWKYNASSPGFEGCNDVAPVIADVDGDGIVDVVVPSSCNPTTYCFDGKTGAVKWAAPTRGSDSPPSVGDIDGDGSIEILHGEFGGYVICINGEDGSVAWELAVDTRSWIQTAPTLLDADSDGRMDFVVATWNSNAGDTNAVRAYRCTDRALLWRVPLADVAYHGSAVADLDRDGKPELCIGDYSGTFSVLNAEDGSIAWSVPPDGSGHYIGAPASIADLDGDGRCEVVFVSWYKIFAYSHDGRKLWEHAIPGYATAFRGAALADVDNDALPDVIFGSSAGLLAALKGRNGSPLWSVDLAAEYGNTDFALDHAPVIADFDGDDTLDAFIVGGHAEYPDFSKNFGRAWALSIGKGEGPAWLMFQHNLRRTSSLCGQNPTGVRAEADATSTAIHGYPVPAREYVMIEAADARRIDVYDAAGTCVESFDARGDRSRIDVTAYAPGVYRVVVSTGSGARVTAIVRP